MKIEMNSEILKVVRDLVDLGMRDLKESKPVDRAVAELVEAGGKLQARLRNVGPSRIFQLQPSERFLLIDLMELGYARLAPPLREKGIKYELAEVYAELMTALNNPQGDLQSKTIR